jgi:PAS domain S-box-containing protein
MDIVANAVFIFPKGNDIANTDTIEAFVRQASIAYNRIVAEENVRIGEEKYRRLAENISDVVWICNFNLETTFVSPSIEKLTGFTPQEQITRPISERHPPETVKALKELLAEELERDKDPLVDKKRSKIIEAQQYKSDGSTIWVSINLTFIRDDKGKPIGMQGVTRDISERKMAELFLVENERKYRQAVEDLNKAQASAKVGNWKWDIQNNMVEWSQEMFNIFEIPANSSQVVLSEILQTRIHPDDRAKVEASNKSVIERKTPIPLEYRIVLPNGTEKVIWAEPGELQTDYHSKPLYLKGIVQDITERKLAMEALHKSEERFQYSMEATNDGLWDWNVLTDETYFSPAYYTMLGFEVGAFPGNGKSWQNLIHPDDKEITLLSNQKCIDGLTDVIEIEYRIRTFDNDWRWIFSRGKCVERSSNGKAIRIVGTHLDITHRKVAEEELRKKTEFIQTISDNMFDLVSLSDLKGNYIFVGASHAMLGYSSDDLMGKFVLDLVNPEDLPGVLEIYQGFMQGKEDGTMAEYRYRRADGSYVWLETVARFIYDEQGNPQNILYNSRDISKRKEIENALRDSEQKYRMLFEANTDGIAIFRIMPDGSVTNFIDANSSSASMLGYSIDEFKATSVEVLEVLDNPQFAIERVQKLKTDGIIEFDTKLRKKNGQLIDVQIKSIVINYQGFPAILNITRDITERKNAVLALEQNNRLINTMLDNLPVGIFMVDAISGKPLVANEHAKRLLGKGIVEDAKTENLAEIYKAFKAGTNEIYPTHEMPIVLGMKGIECYIEDMEVEHPNGERVLLEIFGCPVYNSQGQIWASLVGFLDITERKKNEQTLRANELVLKEKNEEYIALNEELTESNERIIRINSELIKAREKAEESDRLKSAFLANMSHEIRTPMNAIVGFSEMLLNPRIPSEKKDFFAHILNSACHQLLNVVEDVIDISKIETGQMEIHISKANINQIVNRIQQIYYPQTSENGVDILAKCQLDDELAEVNTDSTKLSQILTNLVSNAVKFTENGSIEIGYVVKGEVLEFYVKDSGVGIADEHFDLIFERFMQVDIDNTRKYSGTGLGLPICKAFIEMLGGRIWLESEVGKGSTFKFTLPYQPINDVGTSISSKKKSFDFSGKLVLIAEDEEANYVFISEIIAQAGASILRANDGQEAVDLYLENPTIDIILMDIKMPIISGIEATKMIRGLSTVIPIIALTAYAMSGDREKCLDAGCNDYISKPVRRAEVLQKIANLLT